MCRYCNPLALVRFPTEPLTHHHLSSWTTPTSGKSIRSWTAGSIVVAKDQACFIWSSGRGSTTPPTQQVGNHLNTLQMHLTWSRHSTRLIQISQPPKFIKRGHCLICFCIFLHTDWLFFV